eukprot:jgi/Tetstr1/436269/TSEL_025111.t1
MVKSATLNSFIPEVSVKGYWETLYSNGDAVTDFHNTFHGQQEVKVTPWMDDKRVVEMEVPLSLPAFLRSIAGKDRVPVKETQEFKWSADERTLEIFSLPLSQIPGGAKFNTKLQYTVEQGDDGVSVTAKVFSHASGPFGLGGAIEGVMLEVGTVQTQHWLEFSRERCMSSPTKWWQQAGKLSRAVSRRITGSKSICRAEQPRISTTMEKIQSDLDILEALEPKVNLGEVAKGILSDAQLKEQYAKTMMRTLFMLETAEDNSIDLTPEQALELREMLVQLQKTLANITSRRDELLDACLEYETDSSERVRALAQELQRERVSWHTPDSASDLHHGGRWDKAAPAGATEGDFPGWEFLVAGPPPGRSASAASLPVPGAARGTLASLWLRPSTPESERAPSREPSCACGQPLPCVADSCQSICGACRSSGSSSRGGGGGGANAAAADGANAQPRRRRAGSRSRLAGSAAASDPADILAAPGPSWELWARHSAAPLAACRAGGCSGCGAELCAHQLLLGLTLERAEAQLRRGAPEDAKAESLGQKNIQLRTQIADMRRQMQSLSRQGSQSVTRQSSKKRRSAGSVLLRRVILGGLVVLVGRWGMQRRSAGLEAGRGR